MCIYMHNMRFQCVCALCDVCVCVLGQHFASYFQMPKRMGAVLSGMIMCVNV